jgi:hypothetical protein
MIKSIELFTVVLVVTVVAQVCNSSPADSISQGTSGVVVKSACGFVISTVEGGQPRQVQSGDVLELNAMIKTGADSTADIIFLKSKTAIRLLPGTELKLSNVDAKSAGELNESDTSIKLLSGSIVGSQRKLMAPSHFDVNTPNGVAKIVGTEYIVSASGAVSVLSGSVNVIYNLPGNKGSVNSDVPAGYTFDPATGTVVPTSPVYLQNVIADINTVKENAQVFKAAGATVVVKPDQNVSPTKGSKGNNGVGNGIDPQPPGNPPINDGPGTGPGNPGNKGGPNK